MMAANDAFVQTVIRDLRQVAGYVEAQIAAGRQKDSVLAIQADGVLNRLRNLVAVGMEQGKELTLAVTRGPWQDQQKQQLSSAIDDLVANAQAAPKRRGGQDVPRPENTMVDAEWRSLRDPAPIITAKIAQVATRMWSLGITCPNEVTSFKYAAIICVCGNISDPQEQQDVYDRLKKTIKNLDAKRAYPHGHLLAYPANMAELPEVMLAFAYHGEQPTSVNLPELNSVMMGSPRERGNKKPNKALKRGLCAIKDKAADAGITLNFGPGTSLHKARARLDEHGLDPPSGVAGASGDNPALAARLASTSMVPFKPHGALGAPAPPGGAAATQNTEHTESAG